MCIRTKPCTYELSVTGASELGYYIPSYSHNVLSDDGGLRFHCIWKYSGTLVVLIFQFTSIMHNSCPFISKFCINFRQLSLDLEVGSVPRPSLVGRAWEQTFYGLVPTPMCNCFTELLK